jgi:hypothetical protein
MPSLDNLLVALKNLIKHTVDNSRKLLVDCIMDEFLVGLQSGMNDKNSGHFRRLLEHDQRS